MPHLFRLQLFREKRENETENDAAQNSREELEGSGNHAHDDVTTRNDRVDK